MSVLVTLMFFNEQGSRLRAGNGSAFDFGRSIRAGSISVDDGLPSYVNSIFVQNAIIHSNPANRLSGPSRPVDHTALDCTILRQLLENTPRKLGKIQVSPSEPSRLSQEYLEMLASICDKAERLEYFSRRRSNTAEIECLATRLAQQSNYNGPTELHIDLRTFDTPEKKRSLQHLFRSIAASSLSTLTIRTICDLSEYNLANLLMEALKANRTIRTLELDGEWGHESHMMEEKVMCAILDDTQVEDLRVISRTIRTSEIEKSSSHTNIMSTFFEKLAAARFLKNLELNSGLLPKSDSYLTSFQDAISRNTRLEKLRVRFDYRDERKEAWQRCLEEIHVHLCVNRAARGLLIDHSIPSGLWPHVLQRAGKILYYSLERKQAGGGRRHMSNRAAVEEVADQWKRPSSEVPRADVVYELLRERVLLG